MPCSRHNHVVAIEMDPFWDDGVAQQEQMCPRAYLICFEAYLRWEIGQTRNGPAFSMHQSVFPAATTTIIGDRNRLADEKDKVGGGVFIIDPIPACGCCKASSSHNGQQITPAPSWLNAKSMMLTTANHDRAKEHDADQAPSS